MVQILKAKAKKSLKTKLTNKKKSCHNSRTFFINQS